MLRDKYFNTGNRLARTQSAVQVRTIVTVRDACARTSRRVLKKKKIDNVGKKGVTFCARRTFFNLTHSFQYRRVEFSC